MNEYYSEVIKSLTFNDLQVLSFLSDEDAIASFKAKKNKKICEHTNLTEAMLRTSITRLLACRLIDVVSGFKEKAYYLSKYGITAIDISFKGVDKE
ncbi:hypothetical protein EEL30_20040 [Brevibacillus laterosporus]|uniref:Transcriptional regulator n=1 Tax=Brevibacillus laterosporus TaxID=1465 RepID=A0A518VBJ6_BRELA|nr:hypothetical protein EEL30_20040 [Brevibacillus laterosporus]